MNETLTNTTTSPVTVTYVYTITANGCINTQNVTVTVNPIPALSSTLTPAAICSGTTFSYTPASATAGAAYSWTRAAVVGITEAATTGTDGINEILTNGTTSPITVTYVYTTAANGCSKTENVTVTVNPAPSLTSTLTPAAICSGATFGYTATSTMGGTAFAWNRASVAGITPATASGAVATINEALTNGTASPITVTYVYTMTALGCSNTQNVTVTVNPTPVLEQHADTSGNVQRYLQLYTCELNGGSHLQLDKSAAVAG